MPDRPDSDDPTKGGGRPPVPPRDDTGWVDDPWASDPWGDDARASDPWADDGNSDVDVVELGEPPRFAEPFDSDVAQSALVVDKTAGGFRNAVTNLWGRAGDFVEYWHPNAYVGRQIVDEQLRERGRIPRTVDELIAKYEDPDFDEDEAVEELPREESLWQFENVAGLIGFVKEPIQVIRSGWRLSVDLLKRRTDSEAVKWFVREGKGDLKELARIAGSVASFVDRKVIGEEKTVPEKTFYQRKSFNPEANDVESQKSIGFVPRSELLKRLKDANPHILDQLPLRVDFDGEKAIVDAVLSSLRNGSDEDLHRTQLSGVVSGVLQGRKGGFSGGRYLDSSQIFLRDYLTEEICRQVIDALINRFSGMLDNERLVGDLLGEVISAVLDDAIDVGVDLTAFNEDDEGFNDFRRVVELAVELAVTGIYDQFKTFEEDRIIQRYMPNRAGGISIKDSYVLPGTYALKLAGQLDTALDARHKAKQLAHAIDTKKGDLIMNTATRFGSKIISAVDALPVPGTSLVTVPAKFLVEFLPDVVVAAVVWANYHVQGVRAGIGVGRHLAGDFIQAHELIPAATGLLPLVDVIATPAAEALVNSANTAVHVGFAHVLPRGIEVARNGGLMDQTIQVIVERRMAAELEMVKASQPGLMPTMFMIGSKLGIVDPNFGYPAEVFEGRKKKELKTASSAVMSGTGQKRRGAGKKKQRQ